MKQKNRYIAVGWFNNSKTVNNHYILFDTITNDVKVVSDEAVKLISQQILNINYDEFIDHLSPIWRFVPKRSGLKADDIEVDFQIKSLLGQTYTEISIKNIINKQNYASKNIEHSIIVLQNEVDYIAPLYEGYVIQGFMREDNENEYIIKVLRQVGYNKAQQAAMKNSKIHHTYENDVIFKRGFTYINTNETINQQLEQRNNKLKVLGVDIEKYQYIDIHGSWLINISIDNREEIQIPKCIDYIGYDLTNTLLKKLSSKKRKLKIQATTSQINSMYYNISIMPQICTFGNRQILRDEIKQQLTDALDKGKLTERQEIV